jgi:beta-galactosidase
MKLLATLVLVMLLLGCLTLAPAADRERLLMDTGWRFHLGDIEGFTSTPEGVAIVRWRWKTDERGEASAAEMAAPELNTPGADWQDMSSGQDIFRGRLGFAWCRTVLPEVPGPHRTIYFSGVDDDAWVYLNGKKLAQHEGWDDPFEVALDPAWREGGPNWLAVLVRNNDGPGGINATTLTSGPTRVKPGAAPSPDFDDRSWRVVDVPHDYVVEGAPDPKGDGSHGYRPKGIGWYRRAFTLPAGDKGKRLRIEFDGIYRNSTVWVNGRLLGNHASGYTSFDYDITDVANFGGRNVVAVRVDCTRNEGWWYEGGGLYRHVWLTKLSPVHVDHWGVFVTANVPDPGDGKQADAELTIRTTVVNESPLEATCRLHSEIQDATGKTVAQADTDQVLSSGVSRELTQQAKLPGATLWSLENPYLYRLVTAVQKDGKPVDQVVTPFGVRHVRFDPDTGFFLNGKPVKIKGTCNHQDFAGVGVALPDRVHEFKIQKLKEMGSNAYRCSHHPPAPELLEACDRLGMVVMDENRHLGSSPEILGQVESMVRRDRNHPSIIMWSLCNEEGRQGTPEGRRMGEAMIQVLRRFDTTRPITAAMNGGFGNGLSDVVDLQGFNYNYGAFDPFHQARPKQPCLGSESASILTTRGIYLTDPVRAYMSSYTNGAEGSWRPYAERPYMAGAFVWTGFDYRGEPTPYDWPCLSSHFGIMDTCGFPKDDYWYYQSWWGDKPMIHLAPHWNWAHRPGADIEVRCYSNCDRVELFLNGKGQGAKDMPANSHLEWKVKWEPGTLSAKGTKAGQEVSAQVETAGLPAAIKLSPDRAKINADGEDVSLITVSVVDAQGRVVPTAGDDVTFAVSPNARVLGVGNGDPSDLGPDKAAHRRAFNGLCLALVQSTREAGAIKLTATAPDLSPATVTIEAVKCKPRPSVP